MNEEKWKNEIEEFLNEGVENPRKTIKERFNLVLKLREYHKLFKKEGGKSIEFKKYLLKLKQWEKFTDIYSIELMIKDKEELERYCELKEGKK